MFQTALRIVKWVSLPALLIGSMFSRSAASYELLVDFAICLGAIVAVPCAVRVGEYFWAAGFVAIAVVFSPLLLVVKIVLLMGYIGAATFAASFAAFRTQPAPAA